MGLKKKLSYTLAKRSLALVLVLGLLMAIVQTFFDFSKRQQEVQQTIESIITSAEGSASSAVYLLDVAMANQIVEGLSYFDFFSFIAIVDENGEALAQYSKSLPDKAFQDSHKILLSLFTEHTSSYQLPLSHQKAAGEEEQIYGQLTWVINNHIALEGVYYRAVRAFSIAVFGYLFLTFTLGFMYHVTLTAPLIRIASWFSQTNSKTLSTQRMPLIKGHTNDEFGLIIHSANDMLDRLSSTQGTLAERSQRLRLILDTAPSLIYALDKHLQFAFANSATATFYGLDIKHIKDQHAQKVIGFVDEPLLLAIVNFANQDTQQLSETTKVKSKHGDEIYMDVTLAKFKTSVGDNVLVTCTDVNQRVMAEQKIEHLAYNDLLTSLPNRNKIYDVLHEADRREPSLYSAVALADLDQFKRINDTLGHTIGDQLLSIIALRLKEDLVFSDLIARLGADEFMCIEHDVSSDLHSAMKGAEILGERMRASISKTITLNLQSFSLKASVGVAIFRNDQANADEILQAADTAMYESKKSGRDQVTLFKTEMATKAQAQVQLEHDVNKAIIHNEFYFLLQPIVDAQTCSLKSAEALMRWKKDDKIINPDCFIEFLEESSLILEVGEIILDSVCEYLSQVTRSETMPENFKIAVNISTKQIVSSQFIQSVSNILKKHRVSGSWLEFEITESVALYDIDETITKMETLKKMGITFALDDFGTGYSSLSYLSKLPVDKLKIDRSFIHDITLDKHDESLVRSIIHLASNLGLKTVAEGVETIEQLAVLQDYGELLCQGYYFDKPLNVNEFESIYFKVSPSW